MAQAGDRCDFVGTLIVVPDVGSMSLPGEHLIPYQLSLLLLLKCTDLSDVIATTLQGQ